MGKKLRDRTPDQGRRISSHPSNSTNNDKLTPLFSLEFMVNGHCVESCSQEQKAMFASALFRRRCMTWIELKMAPRHGLGYEKISRDSIRLGVPGIVTDDVDLVSFRCIGLAPMIGFRQGRTFHILWIDRDFSVYQHSG